MSKELIMGLDHGYRQVKDAKRNMFLSTIEERPSEVINPPKNQFAVTYEGKHYLIGSPNGIKITSRSKLQGKEKLYTQLLNMVGVANRDGISESSNPKKKILDVKMCIGAPSSHVDSHREKLISALKEIDDAKIKINGQTHIITISEVIVAHQFLGAAWDRVSEFDDKDMTAVFDLGGDSLNVGFFIGKSPDDWFSIDNIGYNPLSVKLSNYIATEFDAHVDHHYIDNRFAKGYFRGIRNGETEISQIKFTDKPLADFINNHLQSAFDEADERLRTLEQADTVIVSGGTGLRLKSNIEQVLNREVEMAEDPLFANAKCFEAIAIENFGE